MVAFAKEGPRKHSLPGPVLRLFELAQAYSDSPTLLVLGFIASVISRSWRTHAR